MTTYTWPTTRSFKPASAEWRLVPNIIRAPMSPFNGHVQTVEVPGARWTCVINLIPHVNADRAEVEAWLNRVRGAANRIAMWHPVRPLPRGTLQANTTTNATAAAGATSITIAATTGLTLLAGDMLSVATENSKTQLVQVVTDTVSVAGSMTVAFTAPLRWSVANGAAVVVIRPTADFILDDAPSIPYGPVVSPGFSIALTEAY